ncbi:signal peptidase I [Marinicaulis aureus]|uniref:Signal peptidase I n=1 Tax=Hyphococcus aureus TaxID=2666033 RepID=A0ABW1KS79_9PROT
MTEASDETVKRHYWVAALLGLLGVGLGYFYVGRPRFGVAIWMLALALPFAAMHFLGLYLAGAYSAVAIVIILMAVLYFGPIAVIAGNRTIPAERQPKRWHYVIWVIAAVILGYLWALTMKPLANYRFYHIPAGSMAPSLVPGDIVIAKRINAKHHNVSLEPGAVVIFKNNKDTDELGRPHEYVKRLVAVGGQSVRLTDGVVEIDGVSLPQTSEGLKEIIQYGGAKEKLLQLREQIGEHSYSILDAAPGNGPLDNTSVYEIPDGHYFMLGDNRDRSQDSRVISMVGYVPEGNVIGEALYIGFSLSDLSRIGNRLDD